ncbi:MAG TPA: trypsin-like peptidase domain-containing protein, partial [Longimicrobium sp.]|nr:trypsin-like peptidase domain-containing protein [Longimicrobium sp.]
MHIPATRAALPLLAAFAIPATLVSQTATPSAAPLRIRTAVVMEDLSVRAIPQLDLLLISESADTVRVTTDLNGAAEVRLKPGEWKVQSAAPFTWAGDEMVWSQEVAVAAGEGARIDLTNRNAKAPGGRPLAASSRSRPAGRRVSEEAAIFEGVRSGVFTVFSDEGKGSGFLADPAGLVLTNAHVVRNATEVRVQIDSATVVRAPVLSNDPDRDVAVLAIAPGRCGACVTLRLADPSMGPLAITGERILAIGSPLNQAGVLTLGIVSRLEERAIISDVNINHGSSGGPMLNAEGEVIGINTFGDMSSQGGPGISGA